MLIAVIVVYALIIVLTLPFITYFIRRKYLLFNILKNRKSNYYDVRYLIGMLKEKLNIEKLYAHMFRHSMATIWLQNGADLKTVMSVLGHSSIEVTNRYLHTDKQHIVTTYIDKFKI